MSSEWFILLNCLDESFWSNLVTSLDHGILGLTLILYPNALLGKRHGALTLVGGGGDDIDSNNDNIDNNISNDNNDLVFEEIFTDFARIAAMGAGTSLLTVLLYHIFCLQSQRDERVLLRLKLVNYVCQLFLLMETRAILVAQHEPFARWFFLTRLIISAVLALWLIITLMRRNQKSASPLFIDVKSSSPSSSLLTSSPSRITMESQQVELAVIVELAYYLSIGCLVAMVLATCTLSVSPPPASSSSSSSSSSWWESDLFAPLCWQGVHVGVLLTVLMINVEHLPKTDAKLLQIQNILFWVVLAAGALFRQSNVGGGGGVAAPNNMVSDGIDQQQHSQHPAVVMSSWMMAVLLERRAIQLALMLHSLLTVLVWKVCGGGGGTAAAAAANDHGKTTTKATTTTTTTSNNVEDDDDSTATPINTEGLEPESYYHPVAKKMPNKVMAHNDDHNKVKVA